jgi:hypothetical protein
MSNSSPIGATDSRRNLTEELSPRWGLNWLGNVLMLPKLQPDGLLVSLIIILQPQNATILSQLMT